MFNNLMKATGEVGKKIFENKATLLTIGSAIGVAATVVLSAKAGYKSAEQIIEKEEDECRELETKEKVELTWKNYILPTSVALATAGAAIMSRNISKKETMAALATASVYSEKFVELDKKFTEKLGEKKAAEAKKEIETEKENAKLEDPERQEKIFDTGNGKMLCKDKWSGQLFWSDVEAVRRVINDMNQDFSDKVADSFEMNDLYANLGLKVRDCGECVGWDINQAWISHSYETIVLEDGETITIFDFQPYMINPYYNNEYRGGSYIAM